MKSSFFIRFLAGAIILSAAGCEVFPSDEPEYYQFTVEDETGKWVFLGEFELEYVVASAEGIEKNIEGKWLNVFPETVVSRRSGLLGGNVTRSGEVRLDFELWRETSDSNIELVGRFEDEKRDVITGKVFYTTIGGRLESTHTFTVTRR